MPVLTHQVHSNIERRTKNKQSPQPKIPSNVNHQIKKFNPRLHHIFNPILLISPQPKTPIHSPLISFSPIQKKDLPFSPCLLFHNCMPGRNHPPQGTLGRRWPLGPHCA